MHVGRIKRFKISIEMETSKANFEEVWELGGTHKTVKRVIAEFLHWCIDNMPSHCPVIKEN